MFRKCINEAIFERPFIYQLVRLPCSFTLTKQNRKFEWIISSSMRHHPHCYVTIRNCRNHLIISLFTAYENLDVTQPSSIAIPKKHRPCGMLKTIAVAPIESSSFEQYLEYSTSMLFLNEQPLEYFFGIIYFTICTSKIQSSNFKKYFFDCQPDGQHEVLFFGHICLWPNVKNASLAIPGPPMYVKVYGMFI